MHIARCPEEGRAAAFVQSMQGVEAWLDANCTHPDLKQLLLRYLRGRGTITCLECLVDLNLPHILQELAVSQDVISWDGFVTGMVSTKLLPIQSSFSYSSRSSSNAMRWISGLITQLLQVTHTQWIYQCMLVHDCMAGTIISAHKEELLKEIKHQLTIGPEGLNKENWFLLECNFDKLATTTGEHQEYRLLGIQAAKEASCICNKQADKDQQRNIDMGQRWAQANRVPNQMAYDQCHNSDLNNSRVYNDLEGESPLSAVPTAKLICIPCLWHMKTSVWLNLSR